MRIINRYFVFVITLSILLNSRNLFYLNRQTVQRVQAASGVPAAAVALLPEGNIITDQPTFVCRSADLSAWYNVQVYSQSGIIFQKWYDANTVCQDGKCLASPGVTLDAGSYVWAVRSWNQDGYGPWSNYLNFTIGSAEMSAEDAAALIDKAKSQGTIRVIVKLNPAYQSNGGDLLGASSLSAGDDKDQVEADLLADMPSDSVTDVTHFDTMPYTAMKVDLAGLSAISSSPQVLYIQEDKVYSPLLAESIPLIGANNAWASGYSGSGQVIAILDSGIQENHPFLAGKVVSEACYSGGGDPAQSLCPGSVTETTAAGSGVNCDLTVDSLCFHGTHVAGIAAGRGISFSGVAKDANLISIKVFSKGVGGLQAYDSDLIKGLERVFELRNTYNIAAVNLSLGGGRYTSSCDSENQALKAAIDNLRSVGIPTVVASGNSSHSDALASPACISTVISVGATTKSDTMASITNNASMLSLLAPGYAINSSVPTSTYSVKSGTSMATAFVSGAWAVIKSKKPGASVDEVFTALKSTGVSILDYRNGITKPRIQVDAALNALNVPPPAATLVSPNGTISTSRPSYTWAVVNGVTWYKITVNGPSGTLINDWYEASTICSGSQCTVTPDVTLGNNSYTWCVLTWNSGGYGPWSSGMSFTVSGPPGAVTLVSPSNNITTTQPTYIWKSLPEATWYKLWVDGPTGNIFSQWYLGTSVCDVGSGNCSVTPDVTISNGSYTWKVLTWNAIGYGPWSSNLTFTYAPPVMPPQSVSLISPVGSSDATQPVYTWNVVNEATWYKLTVDSPQGTIINEWFQASNICSGTSCSVTPGSVLVSGETYTWKVLTWNSAGYGPWSPELAFTVTSILISPEGSLQNSKPTYSWKAVNGVTWYKLWVNGPSGTVVNQWYESTSVCSGDTCSTTPDVTLSSGSYSWSILTWTDSGGYGQWTIEKQFSP